MIALFFDTETTGIKTKDDPDFKPALVQIGAIMQDTISRRVLGEINLIANQYHDRHMQPGALKTHGVTPEMTVKFGIDPKLIDVLFAEMIEKSDMLVAHNLDYDLDIIKNNMPISVRKVHLKERFCTMDRNVTVIQKPKKDGHDYYGKPDQPYAYTSLLDTFRHYFGTGFDGAHDAMADVRACRDIFFKMQERGAENV
jgi:DNA polymerase-3 subunit epsilon